MNPPENIQEPHKHAWGMVCRFLPSTMAGCLFAALMLWPLVAIVIDIASIWLEPALGLEDFGLTILDYSLGLSLLAASVLWIRGCFLIPGHTTSASWIVGLATLPILLIFNTWVTILLLYPMGRISDTF